MNMTDIYNYAQESSCESVILRDINRTFPAHDFFKETGGLGQDSLYRISKAYAVHDEEVGYCQGLSFLVASLLLHVSWFYYKLSSTDTLSQMTCHNSSQSILSTEKKTISHISCRCPKNKLSVFWSN